MITLKKILFPTDFSDSADQALCHAARLAEKFCSELVMLHVIIMFEADPHHPGHTFPALDECYDSMEKTASHRMQGCLEKSACENIKITKINIRGFSAAGRILEYAQENKVDLIALGTHGRTAITHLLLGSVAEKVVQYAPCPVLTVGPDEGGGTNGAAYEHILVPVDFSDPCRNAMRYAVALGKLYHAHLDVLHVIDNWTSAVFYQTWKKSMVDLLPDIQAECHEAMDEFLGGFDLAGLSVAKNIVQGKAHSEIVEWAEKKKTDLIVIATRGLGGVDHLLLGSTAEKVIRRAPCPVLSVKQQEHEFVTEEK